MTHPSKPRLLLFAFGDFAFNLYWQSVMLFLLFYYTDAVNLPIAVAATIYMIASVWDGIANFLAGVVVDRRQSVIDSRQLFVTTTSRASSWQPMRRACRAMARRKLSSPGPMVYWVSVARWCWAARPTARRTCSCENRSGLGHAAPKETQAGS